MVTLARAGGGKSERRAELCGQNRPNLEEARSGFTTKREINIYLVSASFLVVFSRSSR